MSSTAAPRCPVITVSSSRAAGSVVEDTSGDLVETRLRELPAAEVERLRVADDLDAIRSALLQTSAELVVLTGGTGIGSGDVTPEAVRPLLDRDLPGMGEAMRAAGLTKTAHLDAVWPALPHALSLLQRGAMQWLCDARDSAQAAADQRLRTVFDHMRASGIEPR